MASRNGHRKQTRITSLRIVDFSDRELLAIVSDLEDSEGWASTQAIIERIWPKTARDEDQAFYARQSVSVRFGWMRREADLLEKHDKEVGLWRLTETGDLFLRGTLKATIERELSRMTDVQLPVAMAVLGGRYARVDPVAAWLTRREWQFQSGRK